METNNRIDEKKDIILLLDEIIALLDVEYSRNDPANLKRILESFRLFYLQEGRHYYHKITQYVIEKNKKQKDEENEFLASYIKKLADEANRHCNEDRKIHSCEMLDSLDGRCTIAMSEDGETSCTDYKELARKLDKIYDHINLEIIRLSEIDRRMISIIDASDSLGRMVKEYEKKQTGYDEKQDHLFAKQIEIENNDNALRKKQEQLAKDIELKQKELKEETKSLYMQVVTILGIFATIVVAVFGGLSGFSAFVNAFCSYRTDLTQGIFILAAGMFFVYNLVYVVLGFIAKMYLREDFPKRFFCHYILINTICIVGMALMPILKIFR